MTKEYLIRQFSNFYKDVFGDVFEKSINIFDPNKVEIIESSYLGAVGNIVADSKYNVLIVPCESNTEYVISKCAYSVGLFNADKQKIRVFSNLGQNRIGYKVNTTDDTAYLYITIIKSDYNESEYMVVKGDALPLEYISSRQKILNPNVIDEKAINNLVNANESIIKYDQYLDGTIPLNWNVGYADRDTGAVSSYSSDTNHYYRSNVIKLNPNVYYKYNGVPHALAQTVFYNSPNAGTSSYVSTLNVNDYGGFKCPSNEACYVIFSNLAESKPLENVSLELLYDEKSLNNLLFSINKSITISCTGDSVTEGMSLNGAHYARYGESPYPARLTTLLQDNGYTNVKVTNQGHGGERIADVVARLGGLPCITTENITIPADNSPVGLGEMTKTLGVLGGTKLVIPYGEDETEYPHVYFTQTSHDTNPITIDGVKYNLTVSNNQNFIAKVDNDGKETVIPKGSYLFTNDNRNPSVNIIYAGINDGSALTFRRWLDNLKSCAEVNGGKYVILGATHPLFNNWSDLTGTDDEKYSAYRKMCDKEFGVHFIDLYDEFSRHALDYALSAGYYSDKTADELNEMRQKFENHIIPKEMCYDGVTENNVHLSEEGYHVIAMLIFERLKLLNYI